ncbi:alpha-N-arabinofuranosidase [Gracilimonas mengyeensis]|nr:alpha-L-arabinofuranosidase C-terminal domain-containing protein [Gracilimonas mengyeensis]
MQRFIKTFSPLLLIAGLFLTVQAQAQNARIKIDVDRTIGEVHEHLYGNFTEHLGRHIYGGIYDPDSPLADEDGFREDVLEAVKGLNVSILRYPGGNFVSNYHWLDGVGPVEDRPTRMDLAWDVLETNHFGTNEFMEFAKKVGTEPYFAVNLGTGTIEEARRWVEYTNIEEGPYYAELRKKHGYEEPHDIMYWSLGNEMDGHWQMGHLNAEDYSKKALEAAKLMKWTDPRIKLIAAGSSNYYGEDADPDHWNRTILHELQDYIDYISLHIYVGNEDDDYYDFMASPRVMEDRTQVVRGMIAEIMQDPERTVEDDMIYIAWDEWNVWYRQRGATGGSGYNALEEKYNLEDALVVAGFLNGFIRNADIVKMANMAQLVNVIAPIFTNEEDLFLQSIYYPLQLFAQNAHGTALDVYVDSETYNTDVYNSGAGYSATRQLDVPYLDVSATYNDDGKVVINVVNRHKDEAITADILSQQGIFDGPFEVYEVNGPDIKARNDFNNTRVKTTRKDDLNVSGESFEYTFPAHSFTMIIGEIEN